MAAMSAYLDMAARYPDDDLELSSVAYLRRGKWTVRHRANPNQSTRRDSPTRRAQKWQYLIILRARPLARARVLVRACARAGGGGGIRARDHQAL